jgi:hypothetical protein
MHQKRIKYLINLSKKLKYLYNVNYKTLAKEIKEDTKIYILFSCNRRINIVMQFQLTFQCHFSQK